MNHLNFRYGKRKITIIGAGYVGASIAYALTLRDIANEIVLIDINEEKAKGEALDIQHGIPFIGTSAVRVGDYSECADSHMIIITVGRGRKRGETRLNLIAENGIVLKNVMKQIQKYYNNSVILLVTNPVDIMVHLCDKWMGLQNGMVFGTGCILDTSRLIRTVADYVGLNTNAINGMVVGEHGDSQIPIWSKFTVGGINISDYCKAKDLKWNSKIRMQIEDKVKNMGGTIIAAKGCTHYGIATCVCMLVDAILNQRPTIASVSSPLQGEYGIENISLSVPSIVGSNGVEKRLEEKWNERERTLFLESAETLKSVLQNFEDF